MTVAQNAGSSFADCCPLGPKCAAGAAFAPQPHSGGGGGGGVSLFLYKSKQKRQSPRFILFSRPVWLVCCRLVCRELECQGTSGSCGMTLSCLLAPSVLGAGQGQALLAPEVRASVPPTWPHATGGAPGATPALPGTTNPRESGGIWFQLEPRGRRAERGGGCRVPAPPSGASGRRRGAPGCC